jgi:predicted amidohydrolase/GNAT superfamily N-acetyltransferase
MSQLPHNFSTTKGEATLRCAALADVDQLVALNRLCFPDPTEQNVVWNRAQLNNHLHLFPEGQHVVEIGGQVVGAASSLVVHLGNDPYRAHTYAGITDGGYFHNHNAQGDTLYGADIYTHPDYRRLGIAHELYEARRALCRRLNLRRLLAGGRMEGFAEHHAGAGSNRQLTAEEYVAAVENGTLTDAVLGFHLKEGMVVRSVLRNYVRDPKSKNAATLVEWINPAHKPSRDDEQKVRVAAVQYQVRRIKDFGEFAEQIEYFVETAFDYRADFVVFPEFTTVQLLSQESLRNLPALEGIAKLSELTEEVLGLFTRLAKTYGIHIVAGSHPMKVGGKLVNACPLVMPDGEVHLQPKLHITPSEKRYWGIEGGDTLKVIQTPKAKVGVLICYDAEFPEASRYLADQGIEILFVPYCTDDRQGYSRVRYCCQARAIENQIYVVAAGIVGNLPSVAAMDIHYGRAAVFTPADFEFSRDGIKAEADSNVEMLLVTDLDINDLHRSRTAGSVRPRQDRRSDLFEFRAKFDAPPYEAEDGAPIEPVPDDEA